MAVHVINEARRCLQCKKPLCRLKGCPAQTNIPEMIRLFLAGKSREAGAMLFANNPMSVVCSLVCDHEAQCEGHCIQGRKGSPVQISSIEHYISDAYLDWAVLEREPAKHQQIAVIGSTIFERKDKIGGMMRYGIPEFRLPKSILERYQTKLQALGIRIRPNTTIGEALYLDDLFADGFDAVFIGSGAWKARRLNVRGESLGNVAYAVDYLQNPEVYELGDRVAVIGGGNSAMDVARTAVRMGSQHVTIYCRGQKARASQREIDYALADGVDFEYGLGVAELTPDGPLFRERTFDAEGNVIEEGEPALYPADTTIIAASQTTKSKIVNTTTGLALNDKGLIAVHGNGETSREGVFSGGDVVLGPWNVIQTVKNSKLVAEAMDRYLTAKRGE